MTATQEGTDGAETRHPIVPRTSFRNRRLVAGECVELIGVAEKLVNRRDHESATKPIVDGVDAGGDDRSDDTVP